MLFTLYFKLVFICIVQSLAEVEWPAKERKLNIHVAAVTHTPGMSAVAS